MQLKMENTKTPVKTPKANKNTPKKVDTKQTPLKMGKIPKTPKSDKKTPKSNPKFAQKQQQKQTPQKDQKQNKGKGNKTPQSKPNSPKTPESQSKSKSPGMKPNKKQKLNDSTSKIVKPQSAATNCKESCTLTITFPKGSLPVKEILPVFQGCKDVIFSQARRVELQFDSSENLEKRAEDLKKKKINGSPLIVYVRKSNVCLLKKGLYLESIKYQEAARKFFNAKSIGSTKNRRGLTSKFHVLTFETEEEAEAAASKNFVVNNQSFTLRPYFEPSGKGKVNSTKKVEEAKQEKKQQKPKPEQVKRKAEDSDDDDDDEEEELDGDDIMEDIDIDDDDDDDDEDDDDDDDDDDE